MSGHVQRSVLRFTCRGSAGPIAINMREESFVQIVEREAGLNGALRDLLTSTSESAERFGLEQFVRTVAELEGVDAATAYRHVLAVFVAVGQAVAPQELGDMAEQLAEGARPAARSGAARRGVQ